jgi:hypothetical protein
VADENGLSEDPGILATRRQFRQAERNKGGREKAVVKTNSSSIKLRDLSPEAGRALLILEDEASWKIGDILQELLQTMDAERGSDMHGPRRA